MKKNGVIAVSGGCALILGAIALAWTLQGTSPKNDSREVLYFYENGELVDQSRQLVWDSDVVGSTSKMELNSDFKCPSKSTEAYSFLALRGKERDSQAGWQAYAQTVVTPGTNKVKQPNLKISGLLYGEPGAKYILRIGGDYSLGLACTHDSAITVDTVSYKFVSITPGTGDWKFINQ